jgi:hypothetical protein
MPVCDACRSAVSKVTHEFEDALCDLCLEIQRYDRMVRVEAKDPIKAHFAWLTNKVADSKRPR